MSPKKYYTFMIEPELAAALKAIKERDGISESQQIRLALTAWMKRRGIHVVSVPQRTREALDRFGDEMDVAITQGRAFDVIVPKALGKRYGGGKRFGDCVAAEIAALGELQSRVAGGEIATAKLLVSIAAQRKKAMK